MVIYTDGSSKGNPGPGGFGIVVLPNKTDCILIRADFTDKMVTNNQMEMMAVIYALENFGVNLNDSFFIDAPTVYCDSTYCVRTFTDWMYRWANNGWLKQNGKQPENLALVKYYYNLINKGTTIDLKHVPGHRGLIYNELADALATGDEDKIERITMKLDKNIIREDYQRN